MLAALAGLAVAGRAMRPISSLTAAAREIATTRDPSRRIPMPETDDEVAELARTLDQMLRELDAARSETEQMIQAQREFVADASHELRTPLTSILANLELLEASLAARDADPDEEEIVAGALGSSRRMRRLVADLLLLARADAGRTGPRRACDLRRDRRGRGRRGAAGRRRPRARARRAAARCRSRATPTTCTGWSLNLVENGVRHTPAGSDGHGRGRASRDGDAVVEVSDDGPGLPDGHRRADLLPLRARQRPRRPSPATPAPASASRSSRRSPRRTAGGSRPAARAAGGAPVHRPCCRSRSRRQRLVADSLATLYNGLIRLRIGRDTTRRGHPRQRLAGHPIGQF